MCSCCKSSSQACSRESSNPDNIALDFLDSRFSGNDTCILYTFLISGCPLWGEWHLYSYGVRYSYSFRIPAYAGRAPFTRRDQRPPGLRPGRVRWQKKTTVSFLLAPHPTLSTAGESEEKEPSSSRLNWYGREKLLDCSFPFLPPDLFAFVPNAFPLVGFRFSFGSDFGGKLAYQLFINPSDDNMLLVWAGNL
jgi:hypothetical protein